MLVDATPAQNAFFDACRVLTQESKLLWISASRVDLFRELRSVGLTSRFLNDAAPVSPVGSLESDALLKLVEPHLPSEFVGMVFEWAGRAPFVVQWLCAELWWSPEGKDRVRYLLTEQMTPYFEDWWKVRTEPERRLLGRCSEPARIEELTDIERSIGSNLQRRGLLVEVDGEFLVPGRAWRLFVEGVGGEAES